MGARISLFQMTLLVCAETLVQMVWGNYEYEGDLSTYQVDTG